MRRIITMIALSFFILAAAYPTPHKVEISGPDNARVIYTVNGKEYTTDVLSEGKSWVVEEINPYDGDVIHVHALILNDQKHVEISILGCEADFSKVLAPSYLAQTKTKILIDPMSAPYGHYQCMVVASDFDR